MVARMLGKISLCLLASGLILMPTLVEGEANMPFARADFYVSPEGNDAWSGTLPVANPKRTDGPFASIGQAQMAVRTLRARTVLKRPVTVLIRHGTYTPDEPVLFTPADSGTPLSPTRYAAYPGEHPVISGGRRITGWMQGADGRWTVTIPDVKAGDWYFRDLYVNDSRRVRPRLPKEGFFHLQDVVGPGVKDAFVYAEGDIEPMVHQDEVELVAFNAWDELRFRIKSLDTDRRVITFTGANNWDWNRWDKNNRYYLENVLEAFDEPGKWYLDGETGVLTYYALPGEDPNRDVVVAPVLEELLRFDGSPLEGRFIEHLQIKGLAFHHAGWTLPEESYVSVQAAFKIPGVITGSGLHHCRIEDCEVAHVARYGIELASGCRHNELKRNHIYDVGAGGIKIGEPVRRDEPEARTGQNVIADNHIEDGGKTYLSAVGIWIGQSDANVVRRNHIHDLYYTGISVGWTWGYGPSLAADNVVEYNHIHDLGKGLLSDMGGIYTLGLRGRSLLRYNLIHDVNAFSYGGWGIYFDEGSSNVLAENNICYNTKTGGFHQHYGKDNVVRNNIFAFSRVGQIQRTRPEEHISFTFERNIVYWSEGPLLHGNWGDDRFRMDHNLYWNLLEKPIDFAGLSLEQWQAKGMDANSLIVDPLFQNAEAYDFRIKPGSPALALGFKPFKMLGVPKR